MTSNEQPLHSFRSFSAWVVKRLEFDSSPSGNPTEDIADDTPLPFDSLQWYELVIALEDLGIDGGQLPERRLESWGDLYTAILDIERGARGQRPEAG